MNHAERRSQLPSVFRPEEVQDVNDLYISQWRMKVLGPLVQRFCGWSLEDPFDLQ